MGVLDIGAGDGRWGLGVKQFGEFCIYPNLVGVESRREEPKPTGFKEWHNIDFLRWHPGTYRFKLIVSNPPFKIAEEIIRHAWSMLANCGTMIMLLPLNFSASIGRYNGERTQYKRGLFDELAPVEESTVVRRPSFYGGGTDKGREYAVFIWKKGGDGQNLGMPYEWKKTLLYHERETDTGQDVRPGAVEQLTIF